MCLKKRHIAIDSIFKYINAAIERKTLQMATFPLHIWPGPAKGKIPPVTARAAEPLRRICANASGLDKLQQFNKLQASLMGRFGCGNLESCLYLPGINSQAKSWK